MLLWTIDIELSFKGGPGFGWTSPDNKISKTSVIIIIALDKGCNSDAVQGACLEYVKSSVV